MKIHQKYADSVIEYRFKFKNHDNEIEYKKTNDINFRAGYIFYGDEMLMVEDKNNINKDELNVILRDIIISDILNSE